MMDEEVQPTIKKIITTIDDEKSYSNDIDETTTFYEYKKIISATAHLLQNSFRIYHEQQEYTNDYDNKTIQEMFPNMDLIPLRVISNKDIYEFEEELISVQFNINIPCQIHEGKYKMMYCFTCNKSICMDCLNENHLGHKIEQKVDYLAPAQLLMNNIFSNSALYRADSRLSKYMESVNFRANLKLNNNIFDNLRKLINDSEIKFNSCLEYFSTCEYETEKNTNENLELFKKYCTECFIKLKNDINTKGIIIDDEIFLTLYKKLKEIEQYKTDFFEECKYKYKKLNTLLAPFVEKVEEITEGIRIKFQDTVLQMDQNIYENFKKSVQENIVEKVKKETVNDFMFYNLDVPRKSLIRMSSGSFASYKKNEISKRNIYVSPEKVIKEESFPFAKAPNLSQQININNAGNKLILGSFSKTKNNPKEKKIFSKTKTLNKTQIINNRRGFNFTQEMTKFSNQNNIVNYNDDIRIENYEDDNNNNREKEEEEEEEKKEKEEAKKKEDSKDKVKNEEEPKEEVKDEEDSKNEVNYEQDLNDEENNKQDLNDEEEKQKKFKIEKKEEIIILGEKNDEKDKFYQEKIKEIKNSFNSRISNLNNNIRKLKNEISRLKKEN